MGLLIKLWVVFWIRDGLKGWDNVLTRHEHCESTMARVYKHKSCSHQQPYPRGPGNRGHFEKGYLMGPSPCDTGQQSNGVTVQDNVC